MWFEKFWVISYSHLNIPEIPIFETFVGKKDLHNRIPAAFPVPG